MIAQRVSRPDMVIDGLSVIRVWSRFGALAIQMNPRIVGSLMEIVNQYLGLKRNSEQTATVLSFLQ